MYIYMYIHCLFIYIYIYDALNLFLEGVCHPKTTLGKVSGETSGKASGKLPGAFGAAAIMRTLTNRKKQTGKSKNAS